MHIKKKIPFKSCVYKNMYLVKIECKFLKILRGTLSLKLYLKGINSKAPTLTGLPKLHKEGIPLRPLVNFTTAPGYKMAKKLVNIIKHNIRITNDHSLINSIDFVDKVKDLIIEPSYKLASFDIINLYTNIPVAETLRILKINLINTNKLDIESINELMDVLELILDQNYFTHNNQFFSQQEGLAMGSPLSGLLADIYLNNFENSFILTNNEHSDNIMFYGRYVDDTFLIYKGTQRQIDRLHNYVNNINDNIQFTLENEDNGKLNFLDLTVDVYKRQALIDVQHFPLFSTRFRLVQYLLDFLYCRQ